MRKSQTNEEPSSAIRFWIWPLIEKSCERTGVGDERPCKSRSSVTYFQTNAGNNSPGTERSSSAIPAAIIPQCGRSSLSSLRKILEDVITEEPETGVCCAMSEF